MNIMTIINVNVNQQLAVFTNGNMWAIGFFVGCNVKSQQQHKNLCENSKQHDRIEKDMMAVRQRGRDTGKQTLSTNDSKYIVSVLYQ